MAITISVSDDNRDNVKRAVEEATQRALEMCGQKVRDYASILAPVDTGRLAGSIESVVNGDTVYVGTNVEYAAYQEFGTSKMRAANNGEGFLRPAANRHLDEYKQIFESCLKNI